MSDGYQKLTKDGTLQGVQKNELTDDRIQVRMRIDGEEYGVSIFIGDDIHKTAEKLYSSMLEQYEKLKREEPGHVRKEEAR